MSKYLYIVLSADYVEGTFPDTEEGLREAVKLTRETYDGELYKAELMIFHLGYTGKLFDRNGDKYEEKV